MVGLIWTAGNLMLGLCLFILRKLTNNHVPPIPSAHLLIKKNSRYLVLRRGDGQGLGLPAGIINWSETPARAAMRETLEETGFNTKITRLIGVYSQPKDSLFGVNSIYIVYAGQIISGQLTASQEGQPVWLTKAEIIHLQPDLKKIILDYESGAA